MNKNEPLGMRNNNPLNIRKSSQKFVNEQNSDNAFKKFSSLVYGIRAAIRIIRTYYFNYKLNTISKIIHRWAPTNENDTASYINIVGKRAHIMPDTIFIWSKDNVLDIVKAMAYVECHVELNKADLEEAWKLAQNV